MAVGSGVDGLSLVPAGMLSNAGVPVAGTP